MDSEMTPGPADYLVARAIIAANRGEPLEGFEEDPQLTLREIGVLINRPKTTIEVNRARSKPGYEGRGKRVDPMPPETHEIPEDVTGGAKRPLWELSTILPWLVRTRQWYRILARQQ